MSDNIDKALDAKKFIETYIRKQILHASNKNVAKNLQRNLLIWGTKTYDENVTLKELSLEYGLARQTILTIIRSVERRIRYFKKKNKGFEFNTWHYLLLWYYNSVSDSFLIKKRG